MRKYFVILVVMTLLTTLILGSLFLAPATLAQDGKNSKISGLLDLQVKAKLRAQGGAPLAEGQIDILPLMKAEGLQVADLTRQQIFIHLAHPLSQSQIEELQSMGLTLYLDSWIPPVGYHPTGFIIADMPVDKLSQLAGKNYVMSLDTAERVLEPQNDLSNQKMNADDVWASGYDGSGVTIAVLDSGLDVTHTDIPTPVASWDYAEDDATIANTVTGHGTHVTGSALGRASNTAGSTYNGTAPGADLVFLKIGNDPNGSASTAATVNAMKAAIDDYSADVITMSYGGWDEYHDGTSEEAQAVDYAVNQGAVVFISAGNSANDYQHYSGTVPASSTTDFIQVNISVSGGGTDNYRTAFAYNLVWYDGTGISNDLELEYYNSSESLLASTNFAQSHSDRGTESEYSYHNYYLPGGTYSYYLKVKNNSSNSQFFHLYYDSSYNYLLAGTVEFNSLDADPNYTISSPADADSAIAVGAYTTRTYWYDYNNGGPWQLGSGQTLDQICDFSSQGPRVDTGAPNKVNIVAPGAYIISCRDDDVYTWPGEASAYFVDNDGPNRSNAAGGSNDGNGPADYYVMQGTSMASPHAAGVAALILDKNPDWTAAQVKLAMEANATDKGSSGFDNIYGWGLIDAYDAVNSSLATAASYSDYEHLIPCNEFDEPVAESTVYMYVATGLLPNYDYRVAYYDGSDTKRLTHDVTSGASGNISSQHAFALGTDVAGTWNVIVCEPDFTPSDSYNGTWSYTITSDSFTVQESAIPEFPTVVAAVVALGLCAGIYLWMRRKAVPVKGSTIR